MDFLRTLKKRKPKKHVPATVNVVPPTEARENSRGIRIRRRDTTLNLAFCFALFLGLPVVQLFILLLLYASLGQGFPRTRTIIY